ncbi:signal transduction histidine kinase [Anaerosolibacter carboniphilus]|uniref:histidine kinase n=1 Tax=Anaerosolibacter carboniphilus TaxID=1417629 RepID=A0A841KVR0_9FIRM|nr:sensor histidine kinase [Anaerosolibacter carboniphilus]MBB6214279.1 signal transduction histidine kinase [Anaerosolibacter carboniphilus]
MRFREFLMDRIAYILVYFIGVSMAVLIMYLTLMINKKEFPGENVLYALLISSVVLIMFIAYDYYRNKSFYRQLNMILHENDDLDKLINIEDIRTNEHRIYKALLLKLYKTYSSKLVKYEEGHKQYMYFINQWVHQMKTPVSVMNLILQDQKDEMYKEVFNSIAEENEKISHGLEMMLYNARMSEFNLDFKVESIDIVGLIRKVINDNKKALIRNSIFPKVVGEESLFIETDKKWIYFTINQILINAIKYSRLAKGEKKYITVEIRDEASKVILGIEDEGIGIPKEDIGRVFQAFFTGKNGRRTSESTGMGMYLAKRICDELGHDLLVESEEEKGTRFTIIFHRGKSIFKI